MNLKNSLFSNFKEPNRISSDDGNAVELLSSSINHLIPKTLTKPIVVLCIGTDRSTGDSLGPLVGSKLLDKNPSSFHIFGTLKDPVHAVNLEDTVTQIQADFHNPYIIAIDACLGRFKSVGTFQVAGGPVKPGAGVNKELPSVGDMHITGIVNVSGFMEYFVLQNTRLHLVMTMAEKISESLLTVEQKITNRKMLMNKNWLQRLTSDSTSLHIEQKQ